MSYGTGPTPDATRRHMVTPTSSGPCHWPPTSLPFLACAWERPSSASSSATHSSAGYASQSEFWWPFLLLQIVIPSGLYMLIAIISIPVSTDAPFLTHLQQCT